MAVTAASPSMLHPHFSPFLSSLLPDASPPQVAFVVHKIGYRYGTSVLALALHPPLLFRHDIHGHEDSGGSGSCTFDDINAQVF